MKKTIVFSFALALFAASSFASDANGIRKAPELAFTVPGQGQRLLSQYRGKVVALEFIATTCPHCQAAARFMTQIQQQYGNRGFQALDVAINAQDEGRTVDQANALVAAFTANFQVGFPVGWASRDEFMSFTGFSFAEMVMVPQVVLIDRKGYIHYQTSANGDDDLRKEPALRKDIDELLAPTSPSAHVSAKPRASMAKKGS